MVLSPIERVTRASAVLGLPLAAWGLSGALLSGNGWPLCAFRHFTGLPCPLCGGTHAVFHLLRLDVVAAFQANAAVTAMVLGLGLLGLRFGLESLTGRVLPAIGIHRRWRPWPARLLPALLVLSWAASLYRL
jgi:hypothetical protein